MAGFGASTDYFGLADSDWEMQGNGITPEGSSHQTADEFGDVVCESEYEKTETVEVVYKCKKASGNVELPADFIAGHTNTQGGVDYVITGGTLTLSNTDRPTLTVQGRKVHGATTGYRLFDFATEIGEFGARKVATPVGFALGANTLLNSTTVTFSLATVHQTTSALGAIVMLDMSGGRIEASGDLVSCSAVPSATAAAGWTLATSGVSLAESNTSTGTGTVSVYKNLEGAEQVVV